LARVEGRRIGRATTKARMDRAGSASNRDHAIVDLVAILA
jgi:hypothetical protein